MKYPKALIIIAGDFNCINCNFITEDLAMKQIVTKATHNNIILDK